MGLQLQIGELDDTRRSEWDEFVRNCADATFFHLAGWKRVIERSFRHRTYYLYAERGGVIEGVLPMVHIKAPLLGDALTSVAFCVYGGPAASNAEAASALDEAARALGDRLDVAHLEYRHLHRHSYSGAIEKSDLYVTFRKPIEPEVEKNLLAIPRKQRAMIRKAQKLGLQSEVDADCRRLFGVYSESVRNLGTPVFSRRYFEELKSEFGQDCEIVIITDRGTPVSGVMNFYFRDEVLPYYGGGTRHARDLAANDFMYWEVMRRACERGCRLFDFGRSKRGTGAFDFKKNWGFVAQSLFYQYIIRRGQKPPDINPLNPKLRLFVQTWKHLPLPIANFFGPHIVRYLG